MVDATFDLIREARENGPFATYTLLSGVDWPVKPIEAIVEVLDNLEVSLIDFWRDKDPSWHQRYERYFFYERPLGRLLNALSRRLIHVLPKRKPPVKVWFGPQWWTLRDEAVRTVLDFYANRPDVLRWLRTIHIPDECAIQTALCNSEPRPPLERGHRRYLDWSSGEAHPKILTSRDLEAARQGEWLFARKVHCTSPDGGA